ncbi:MAG: response regulator [Chloroflexi bacterium]|nr:response regulator [Chloroflexota bacterium]
MTDYVLVIDDNADMRVMLANFFEEAGIPVDTAENGKDALEKMQANPPAAIILDVMMPVMDGLTLLTRLRSHPELTDTPVVILSAVAQEDQFKGLPNVVDVLRKGQIDIDILMATVERLGLGMGKSS